MVRAFPEGELKNRYTAAVCVYGVIGSRRILMNRLCSYTNSDCPIGTLRQPHLLEKVSSLGASRNQKSILPRPMGREGLKTRFSATTSIHWLMTTFMTR